MKKKNAFTDALNEEMSNRKILAKAKPKPKEAEIFVAENIVEDEEPPIDWSRWDTVIEEPAPKTKKTVKKVSKQKDADFEKRVFAEADNDFFDEKQPENIGNTFRSKMPQKKSRPATFHTVKESSDDSSPKEEPKPEFDPELNRKLSRAEITGVALSALAMLYSFTAMDKPLFFLALSLFTHLMRPLIGAFCGKHNRAVQNGLRSFSFVIFAGAILLLFMLP